MSVGDDDMTEDSIEDLCLNNISAIVEKLTKNESFFEGDFSSNTMQLLFYIAILNKNDAQL